MRINKKNFLIVVSIIVLLVVILIITKNKSNTYVVDENKKDYYTGDGWHELVLEVAKKDNDWTGLPLSKNFRKKYNSKDGILGKIEFDTIELNPFSDEENFIGTMCHLLLKKDKEQFAYIYKQKYEKKTGLLDDVILEGPINLIDENGNELYYAMPFKENWEKANIYNLARGNIYETGVAITDNFHKKYPFFLDLFIHFSPLSYNRIEFLEKESDLDNDIAIFEVNSILECKTRKYEVKLIFDDKLYLDDAEVKLVKEEDYRGDSQYTTLKILYKNSNWDNIKITDKYRKKFNGKSFIEDIDNIDINYFSESKKIADHEFLRKYRTISGNFKFYYGKFIYTSDEKIDDVICKKLDYDSSFSIDEAMEKFLKEYNN